MTRRAVDVEPFAAACKRRMVDRQRVRHCQRRFASGRQVGLDLSVFADRIGGRVRQRQRRAREATARRARGHAAAVGNRAVDVRSRRPAVGPEAARDERRVLRLTVHVLHRLFATAKRQRHRREAQREANRQADGVHGDGTSETRTAPSVARKSRVAARSNRGSAASTHKKNRFRVARSKSDALKIG